MNEAAQTTGSLGAILAIVIIMPILAMILIIAPAVADSWQARAHLPTRGAADLGPAIADVVTHTGAFGEDRASADKTITGRIEASTPAAGKTRERSQQVTESAKRAPSGGPMSAR
jgi:hypothetical protein